MNRKKVIYGKILLIFTITIVLGSISTSNTLPIFNGVNDEPSLMNFDRNPNIQTQNINEKSKLSPQVSVDSLISDQWSYTTRTYYKNDIDWKEINATTADILPFSHRYRVNYQLDDWENAYGMTPGYVPINLLQYTNNSVAPGTVWTNETGDFPSVLRFIPNFPVTITLDVVNSTIDGEVSLFVYDSTNSLPISQSTNVGADSVTFTPTTEEIHVVRIENIDSINARIILTVKQNINPSLFTIYVGDAGKQYNSFNWQFSTSINSFGLLTPDNLDLSNVSALDDLGGSGEINYTYGLFDVHGKDLVYDNDTWLSNDLFFRVSGDNLGSCNGALLPIDQCNGFLRGFFSSEEITVLNTNGVWTSLNPSENSYGANPQILKFMSYYGQGSSPLIIDSIELTDNIDNNIYTLSSSDFKKSTLSSFSDQYEVKIRGQDLSSGNYKLKFLSSSVPIYEYSFSIDDSLYGNFNPPVVSLGYEEVDTQKTLVFLKTTDIDTTIDQVAFSYTTDGSTWTDSRNMTLIEGNSYGFIINGLSSSVLNYSLTLFESAVDDMGNTRFKIRNVLGSDIVDLNSETNTTLDLKITAYGSSPSGTIVKFGLKNEYNLIPETGNVFVDGQNHRYDIATTLNEGQEYSFKFTFIPKNPSVTPLQIPVNVSLGIFSDLGNFQVMVNGQDPPLVDLSFGTLPILYTILFDTYNVKVFYSFNGGSPKTNATLDISSTSGSFEDKFIQLDYQNTYPNTEYMVDVTLNVVNDFEGENDDITITLSFDDSSEEISEIIEVNSLRLSELFEISLVDAPFIFGSTTAEEVSLNISVKSNVEIDINDLSLTFIVTNTDHTANPSSISVGPIAPSENRFFTVTLTIKANFIPDSSIYSVPISIKYGNIEENIVFELETDYTPSSGSTSLSNSSSSSGTSSSAPPTPGFEVISILSMFLVTYLIFSRKRK